MTAEPLVRLAGVSRTYHLGGAETVVLREVDLEVGDGEFCALQGPSGSGKSTLLHIMGLLDRPSAGEYYLRGRNTAGMSDDDHSALRNRLIGFVFQSFYLIPYATALGNVMLPGLYKSGSRAGLAERAGALLERVGLKDHMRHKPSQLSGGQQQRVALARALVNDPDLILADEPTGQLDSTTSAEIMGLLTEINRRDGKTIVVVTHDEATAAYASRNIRVHDGRIV